MIAYVIGVGAGTGIYAEEKMQTFIEHPYKLQNRKMRIDCKLLKCWNEAVILYVSGFSTVEIGNKFGIDPSNVYRVFVSRGIKIRNRSESLKAAFEHGRGNLAKGKDSSRWKGGIIRHSNGYVMVYNPNHPKADCRGYVYKAILVVEKKLKRCVKKGEVVHHVDGNKLNNSPNNLRLLTPSKHARLHYNQGDLVGLKLGPSQRRKK